MCARIKRKWKNPIEELEPNWSKLFKIKVAFKFPNKDILVSKQLNLLASAET